MDFAERVKAHAKRVQEIKSHATTEEATKTALILPFLQMLGYDIYDPRVVIPEYSADFGEKKACKVDYAIKRGDDIVMIIEAKKVGDPLDGSKEGQLQRYFQTLLPVKIAILTDGIRYKFYTDLVHTNVMDNKPFMTFDFSAINEPLVSELQKLCNDCFDVDAARCAAKELTYLWQLKKMVAEELDHPSDDTVRLFAKQIHDGPLRENVLSEYRGRVKQAFDEHINEVINARLQSVMQPTSLSVVAPTVTPQPASVEETKQAHPAEEEAAPSRDERIVTTDEELEGYHIVRAIMSKVVDPERVPGAK